MSTVIKNYDENQRITRVVPLREMMIRTDSEPKMKMIYPGIIENSIGFVFGPAKSGKTTFCENLGLSIASGARQFLNKPSQLTIERCCSFHWRNSTQEEPSGIKAK